jgi:hypothetical protein
MNMAPVHGPNRLKAKPTALVREPEVKVKRAGIPLAGVALTAGRPAVTPDRSAACGSGG